MNPCAADGANSSSYIDEGEAGHGGEKKPEKGKRPLCSPHLKSEGTIVNNLKRSFKNL